MADTKVVNGNSKEHPTINGKKLCRSIGTPTCKICIWRHSCAFANDGGYGHTLKQYQPDHHASGPISLQGF